MNFSSEIINSNSSITNGTKDIQTTTKPPSVIFVILLSEDTLEKIQTTTKPPIVETLSSNQDNTQVPISNNASFIDNAKASFIIKTNNSNITNDTKDIQTTTKPPIVETLSSNQDITQVKLSKNASFIDNAIYWIDNAKASFIIDN
jgi:hypothetical protein